MLCSNGFGLKVRKSNDVVDPIAALFQKHQRKLNANQVFNFDCFQSHLSNRKR